MLIESLAQKTKLALMTVLATIGGCTLICGFTVWCCISLVTKEREQIYILDGDIPFLAQRAQLEANFTMEAKAHIQLFHQYFFNLPPDNDYIKWTVGTNVNVNGNGSWTVLPSSRSRHWMRTDFTLISSLLQRCVPSCVTPFSSTNMNGNLPTTERSSSSAVLGT